MPLTPSAVDAPETLDDAALDLLFRKARTYTAWLPKPVTDEQLHAIYELFKWGPTSANTSPARVLFLTSEEAKARLLPALAPNNVEKSRTAPVVAVIAYDVEFYEKLPELYPSVDARAWFVGKPDLIQATAFRNGTLQGAYFILAARALGLDCGPMSGFDAEKLDAEFFPDGTWKANFVCNLGYGDAEKLYPRNPRLSFDEACKIL
ncbi:MAG: nitroreductase [Chthonomonadaceae bacterium]|nr:nitroreductase [Chthonomonadaceae bacterium]